MLEIFLRLEADVDTHAVEEADLAAVEEADLAAENTDLRKKAARLRGKLPDEKCRVAFDKVVAEKDAATAKNKLNLLEVLGNKGERYSHDLTALGL
jgi:hypothetical protein